LSISAQSFPLLCVQHSSFYKVSQQLLGEFHKMVHSGAPTADGSCLLGGQIHLAKHGAVKWSGESGECLKMVPSKTPGAVADSLRPYDPPSALDVRDPTDIAEDRTAIVVTPEGNEPPISPSALRAHNPRR